AATGLLSEKPAQALPRSKQSDSLHPNLGAACSPVRSPGVSVNVWQSCTIHATVIERESGGTAATVQPLGSGDRLTESGQQLANTLGRQRLAEQVSLPLSASFALQLLELRPRLDAFRRRRHPQAAAQPGNGTHDRHRVGVGGEVSHERPVDLDLV